MMYIVFFFNDTATTEIYTEQIVGSVRCVQETDIYIQTYLIRMEVENKVLTIITNDGKKFDVDGRIQKLSGLIQTTLQDTQETEIPIPDVDGDVFQKVVEYCQLHDYNPRPVSYTHLRAHETPEHLVCRLLLEKKKKQQQ
eukprot:TRINITY_DN399_c0_g1_i2.p2 TRINITY_DN399_c0_g1~~TRINITY_DN399_c0_g1_i2.p2  ORF type:complete len:140 (+),score=75.94 TRINITY_DN399_c0_g1_i2:3-422(+)